MQRHTIESRNLAPTLLEGLLSGFCSLRWFCNAGQGIELCSILPPVEIIADQDLKIALLEDLIHPQYQLNCPTVEPCKSDLNRQSEHTCALAGLSVETK